MGEYGCPVARSRCIADDDLQAGQIEIFDGQPGAFDQAQSAAIDQIGH